MKYMFTSLQKRRNVKIWQYQKSAKIMLEIGRKTINTTKTQV